jgi:hypothetical protein
MNIVPVKLNPHLIPFFYKEFKGEVANYMGRKVKACKISTDSSLGFMIRSLLQKCDVPVKYSKYYVYITFEDNEKDCSLYNVVDGKSNFLYVPEHACQKINTIFEDLFRMAYQYHTQGMVKANPDLTVKEAVSSFMVEYEMDEHGYLFDSVYRLLYRNHENKLSRLQSKVSNRFMNF